MNTLAPTQRIDWTALRERWLVLALDRREAAVAELDKQVAELLAQQVQDRQDPLFGGWRDVDSLAAKALSWGGEAAYRLLPVARAWRTPGSRYFQADEAAAALDGAASFLARIIHPGCEFPNNWWAWQIGIPHVYGQFFAWAGTAMQTETRRALLTSYRHLVEAIWSFHPAANRMSAAVSYLGYGLAAEDETYMEKARTWAREASDLVRDPSHDPQGFRADGTYFYHGAMVNLGYGRAHFLDLAKMMYILDGSAWALPTSTAGHAVRLLLDFMRWTIVGDAFDPFIVGRGISLKEATMDVESVLEGALLLAAQDVPRRQEVAACVARLIADGVQPQRDYLRELAGALPAPVPHPAGVRYYAEAEYLAVRRPGWHATVKMASWRTKVYPGINKSNLKGWHISDGHLNLRLNGREFRDGVIPAMDWERLTGITRADDFKLPAETMGHSWLVTGTDDGTHGCCGLDFVIRNVDRTELLARKSWFMLDEAIVALGSGIHCDGDSEVETVIRQVVLPAEASLPDLDGETLFLEGHDCTYILPDRPRVKAAAGWRTGRFSDLRADPVTSSHQAETHEYRRRFWTAVIPHGRRPEDARYTIVYLPGKSLAEAKDWWKASPFTIEQQDSQAHIVCDLRRGKRLTIRQWSGATISENK